MPGSFRLGRIADIDIEINISWLIILVLLTASLAIDWFPQFYPGWSIFTYWITAFIAAILLFASVLLHELAHSFVARARGLSVKSITLFIFGGVSNLEQEPKSAGVEFQMAFIGPVVSIVIGVLAYVLQLPLRGSHSPVEGILGYLAFTNILLGIFNLIPGFPLDGGRVLRSIVWRITGSLLKATRVATIVGTIIAYLFIFWGIWQFFGGNILGGIWIGFIGWFLLNASQSANSQVVLESMFRGVKVEQVMNAAPATVPANISLQRLVDEYFLPHALRSALVMQGDQLAGLITLNEIRRVPREQWAQVPVGHVMIPLEKLHVVSPDQSLNEVLPLMVGQNINQLPVVQNGQLVGLLDREAVVNFVELKRSLGLDRMQ